MIARATPCKRLNQVSIVVGLRLVLDIRAFPMNLILPFIVAVGVWQQRNGGKKNETTCMEISILRCECPTVINCRIKNYQSENKKTHLCSVF